VVFCIIPANILSHTYIKNIDNYADWTVSELPLVLKTSNNHHELSCHWTTLREFIKNCCKNTK